jgi:hypothetical protein
MALKRIILLLCAATLVLACGGDEETVEIEGGEVTFEAEGEGVRISGEQEGVGAITGRFGENAEIPDGFPEDIPIYPGSDVVAGMVAGAGGMVTLQTGDDAEKVAVFYREKLVEEGWTLGPEMDLGAQLVLPIQKEGQNGAVQISREADVTNIVLTAGMGPGS